MQGLWLEDRQLSLRRGLPAPTLLAGEALVRVRLAGICATDLELLRGYYPYAGIPGHEFVGEICAAPDAPQRVGQRVVGEINIVCGKCIACVNGRRTHCERRATLGIHNWDGAFAEYLRLPLENLHAVHETVPDQAAVFTEPLAAALEIQQQVQVRPADQVLLVGAGRLGQLIARTLALTGCDLHVLARHPQQISLLKQAGIHCLEVDDIPAGKMDMVVEATGAPEGFELARRALRPRGTLVLKSTYAGEMLLNFSSIVVNEITILGSRCGPFPPALRLLEDQRVDPTCLVAGCYSLEQGLQAFERAAQPGVLKVLLAPGQQAGVP